MAKLKLKINVNLLQLLCIVVSVALHGEFQPFGGFCVDCYYTLLIISINFPSSHCIKRKKCQVTRRKELFYYVTRGSNVTRDVH